MRSNRMPIAKPNPRSRIQAPAQCDAFLSGADPGDLDTGRANVAPEKLSVVDRLGTNPDPIPTPFLGTLPRRRRGSRIDLKTPK